MNMLDVHAAAMESVDEAFHLFLIQYKADGKTVYGIVEGKDDPMFYRSAIDRFIPEGWEVDFIRGGNKEKVLRTFSQFDWSRFNRSRIAFFVDKDVDDFIGLSRTKAENIYYTDGYSIENSVVNRDLFMRIIVEVYNLGDLTMREADSIKTSFREDLAKFQDALAPVMAQIIDWRINGVKANLNNLDLRPLFRLEDGRLHLEQNFTDHMERVKYAADSIGSDVSSRERIEEILAHFMEKGGTDSFTRGKYLIWFLSALSLHVHSAVSRITSTYRTSPKLKIAAGQANMMILAAPRARCPNTLRKFIERTFVSYIESNCEV